VEPIDVRLGRYIVASFDGRVLELFGPTSPSWNRFHVALISSIRADADKIVVSTTSGMNYSVQIPDADDGTRTSGEDLVEQVRRAAPGAQ
jgi:hypothetical protein